MSAITAPTQAHSTTAKAISFRSSSTACCSRDAPRCCPTTMLTVVPIAKNAQKNRFDTVLEMFIADTTSSPRRE